MTTNQEIKLELTFWDLYNKEHTMMYRVWRNEIAVWETCLKSIVENNKWLKPKEYCENPSREIWESIGVFHHGLAFFATKEIEKAYAYDVNYAKLVLDELNKITENNFTMQFTFQSQKKHIAESIEKGIERITVKGQPFRYPIAKDITYVTEYYKLFKITDYRVID